MEIFFFAVANTRRSGCADRENWVPCRCYRISGPGRAARVLLSSARPQGTRLLAHLPAFQGKMASASIGDYNNLFLTIVDQTYLIPSSRVCL